MSKSRSFLLILIPSAMVFISSFCIMVLVVTKIAVGQGPATIRTVGDIYA